MITFVNCFTNFFIKSNLLTGNLFFLVRPFRNIITNTQDTAQGYIELKFKRMPLVMPIFLRHPANHRIRREGIQERILDERAFHRVGIIACPAEIGTGHHTQVNPTATSGTVFEPYFGKFRTQCFKQTVQILDVFNTNGPLFIGRS